MASRGCPILAGFARVGIFGPSISTFPVIFESDHPPLERYKEWGTHESNYVIFVCALKAIFQPSPRFRNTRKFQLVGFADGFRP